MKHTKIIDGITYETETLDATMGLRILPKIISLFGEPLLRVVFGRGEEVMKDPEMLTALLAEPAVIGQLFAGMAANAAENDGLMVIKDLLAKTKADKVRVGETEVPADVMNHFDGHFGGRYMHLLSVAMWVATCNFIGP